MDTTLARCEYLDIDDGRTYTLICIDNVVTEKNSVGKNSECFRHIFDKMHRKKIYALKSFDILLRCKCIKF